MNVEMSDGLRASSFDRWFRWLVLFINQLQLSHVPPDQEIRSTGTPAQTGQAEPQT
jgi:hypothetical protein